MPAMATSFAGFAPAATAFLAALAENNERSWFEARRDLDERGLLEPARALVVELGRRLAVLAPGLHAEPRVNGSILRLNRDLRFGADRRPYKTHLDLWFWEGPGASRDHPGFFIRLTAAELVTGAGIRRLRGERLERYRRGVADPAAGAALEKALARVLSAGPYELGGRTLRRIPSGHPAGSPAASLLQHTGLWAQVTIPHPPQLHGPELITFCFQHHRRLAPLQRWLSEALAGPPA